MSRVIVGMTQSVDGFVMDRSGSIDALYTDMDELRDSAYMRSLQDETGAVVMGRRSFEMADDPDWFADAYEFQVPIVVVTHHPPERHPAENDRMTFTFVEGVEPAIERAKAAAGDRAVTVVGGVDVNRQLLLAGLVDELHVEIMPIFLGEGTRLLDDPDLAGLRLEKLGVGETGERTILRFAVASGG